MEKRSDLPARHGAWSGNERCYRIVAAKALGRNLKRTEIVHHHGSGEQIVICENQQYHMLLHRRTRVFRNGGDPDKDVWCSACKRARPSEFFYVRKTTGAFTSVCKPCSYERVGIKITDADAVARGTWSEARKARMGKTKDPCLSMS